MSKKFPAMLVDVNIHRLYRHGRSGLIIQGQRDRNEFRLVGRRVVREIDPCGSVGSYWRQAVMRNDRTGGYRNGIGEIASCGIGIVNDDGEALRRVA